MDRGGPEDALPQQPAPCGETWEHCSIPTLAELVWVLAALQGVAQPRSGQVLSQTNPFTDQAAVCWGPPLFTPPAVPPGAALFACGC